MEGSKDDTHSELIIVDPVPWLGLLDSCEQHRRNISSLKLFHKHLCILPIWTLLLHYSCNIGGTFLDSKFSTNIIEYGQFEHYSCCSFSLSNLGSTDWCLIWTLQKNAMSAVWFHAKHCWKRGNYQSLTNPHQARETFTNLKQKLMITIGPQKNVYVYHDWYT